MAQFKHDRIEIAAYRIIAARLRESRNLCGFRRSDAAKLLGLTDDELQDIESGFCKNNRPQPIKHSLLMKASQVYSVSTDYLFGGSDDWERDLQVRLERTFVAGCLKNSLAVSAQWMARLDTEARKVDCIGAVVGQLPNSIKSIDDALTRFRQLNPDFDEMPGGAALVKAIEDGLKNAVAANAKMVRRKVIPKSDLFPMPDEMFIEPVSRAKRVDQLLAGVYRGR